jgi:Tol biopolymer transport system component
VATDDTRDAITWVYRLSGEIPLRRLTFVGGRNDNAVWSGDGQWLIMRSNREGGTRVNLFRQRVDGTGTPERVTEALKAELPDGVVTSQSPGSGYWSGPNQIFTQNKGPEYDLWTFSTIDKKAKPFDTTPGSEQINGGFSPDGRWVAYSSNETGRFEIYVRPFSGSSEKFQLTRDGGGHPQWAANGKELYFDNKGTIYFVPIQFQPTVTWGSPVALPITGFYQPDGRPRHYDLSPDGKYFVMIFTVDALTKTTEPSQIQYVLNWFEELKLMTSR